LPLLSHYLPEITKNITYLMVGLQIVKEIVQIDYDLQKEHWVFLP